MSKGNQKVWYSFNSKQYVAPVTNMWHTGLDPDGNGASVAWKLHVFYCSIHKQGSSTGTVLPQTPS